MHRRSIPLHEIVSLARSVLAVSDEMEVEDLHTCCLSVAFVMYFTVSYFGNGGHFVEKSVFAAPLSSQR